MTWCPHNPVDLSVAVVRDKHGIHHAQARCSECEQLIGRRVSLTKLVAIAAEVDDLAESLEVEE